jgi:poly-gamma-glutamate capsule biosynthesis protein CapA/YwtB (metallophosphatase superfamily)
MICDNRLRLLLAGDINASRYTGGLRRLLANAAPDLRRADLVYGNVEFPMTDRGRYTRETGGSAQGLGWSMKPEDANALKDGGFHVVSLANNHIMDFGTDGLLQTIEMLDANGIAHCGAGPNIAMARKPAIVSRNGIRVAFLSYTSVFTATCPAAVGKPGVNVVRIESTYRPDPKSFESPGVPPIVKTIPDCDHMEAMRGDVRNAKSNADLVVVSWHWGVAQGYRKRIAYQTECGRAAIDAGAALVIGHHPHVLQGVEVYRSGAIFYSLGNFAFWNAGPLNPKFHDLDTVIVDCQIDQRGIESLTLRPVQINDAIQPELTHDCNAEIRLRALVNDSKEFETRFINRGDALELDLTATRVASELCASSSKT